MMVVGIGCFGLIGATVTALFVDRTRDRQASPKEIMAVLEDIRQRVSQLEKEQLHAWRGRNLQVASMVGVCPHECVPPRMTSPQLVCERERCNGV